MSGLQIISTEGIDNLKKRIQPEIRVPDRVAVGIVADANDDMSARWQSISARLRRAGIEAPDDPDPAGTVIASQPRVGVWLMPNNQRSGKLEDFVMSMIPPDDAVWPLAEDFIDSIPESERPQDDSKAKVHAWLAAKAGARRMGTAIRAGDFSTSGQLAINFIAWAEHLFIKRDPVHEARSALASLDHPRTRSL